MVTPNKRPRIKIVGKSAAKSPGQPTASNMAVAKSAEELKEQPAVAGKPAGKKQTKKTSSKAAPKSRAASEMSNPAVLARQMYMDTLLTEHANKRKSSLMYRPRSKPMKVGLPVPFPIEFLIDSAVLPLGVVVDANGPPMSCKSMLMYEFGRIASESNGWMESVLTEGKASETAARSVVGWNDVGQNSFTMNRAKDLNDAMQLIRNSFDNVTATQLAKNPQTGKPFGDTFPVVIAIDSIMGALARETMEKIHKKGEAGRSFPVEALQLTTFMKYVASKIQSEPWLFFLVNHRKEGKPDPNKPYAEVEFSKPGGKQIQFSDSYEFVLHMMREWAEVDQRPDGGVEIQHRTIKMKNGKNSGGTNGRVILVDVSWRNTLNPHGDGTEMLQQTKWNWDAATVDLIMRWKDPTKHKLLSRSTDTFSPEQKMDQFFHIRKVTGDLYWSKNFGMKASDAISKDDMGARIQADPAVRAKLRLAFGIAAGVPWVGGTSYKSTLNRVLKQAQADADAYLESAKARLATSGSLSLTVKEEREDEAEPEFPEFQDFNVEEDDDYAD